MATTSTPTEEPKFLKYSPADVLTMGQERGLDGATIAKGLVKHARNLEEYGRSKGDGEKFWQGMARVDMDTMDALQQARELEQKRTFQTELPEPGDQQEFLYQLHAGGYDPDAVEERFKPVAQKLDALSKDTRYDLPAQRIHGAAVKVGETPLAFYSLRRGATDGKVDAYVTVPGKPSEDKPENQPDQQYLVRVNEATEDEVKAELPRRREAVARAYEEWERMRHGMAVDPLGNFLGRDERARQKLEQARASYLGLLKGRDQFLLGERVREELKKPEWRERVGSYAGWDEFWKGTMEASLQLQALQAGVTGDQEKLRGTAEAMAAMDSAMPGSTRRGLEGGLWNESVSGAQRALGNMAPSLAAGAATRGGTAVAGRMGVEMAKRELARQVAGRLGVSGLTMSLGASGGAYAETEQQIQAAEQAGDFAKAERIRQGRHWHALLTGVTEGAVERMGTAHLMAPIRGGVGKVLGELGSEAIEEPVTGIIQRGLVDPVTIDRRSDVLAPVPKEALTGLLAAGPMVGTSTALGAFSNRGEGGQTPAQRPAVPGSPLMEVAARGGQAETAEAMPQRVPSLQDDPFAARAEAGGGNLLVDYGIQKTPEAQARVAAAEQARLQQAARLRAEQARAGSGMPVIPDSPLGVRDILDFMNQNPVRIPKKGSEEAGKAENDWREQWDVPAYFRRFIAKSDGGHNAADLAHMAFEEGLIAEPTADALMTKVQDAIKTRRTYRVELRKQEKALADEERRVVNFENTQANNADKMFLAFSDVMPGDGLTIEGENAVVRDVEWDEDGHLTNVVIEDGRKFGVLSIDPQTRGGVFVDEWKPKDGPEVKAEDVTRTAQNAPQQAKGGDGKTGQPPDSPAGLFIYEERDERDLDEWEQRALYQARRLHGHALRPTNPVRARYAGDTLGPRRAQERDHTAQRIGEAILQLFRKRVLWVDGPENWHGLSPPDSRNVLVLNANSRQPLLWIVGHELTHALEAQQNDLYQQLHREVMAAAKDQWGAYQQQLESYGYRPEEHEKEFVADFVGGQMLDPDFMNRLAGEKPTLFQRLAGAILRFIDSLLGKGAKLERDVKQFVIKDIVRLRNELAKALREYSARGVFPDNPISVSNDNQLAVTHKAGTPFEVKNLTWRQILTGSPLPKALVDIVGRTQNEKRAVEQTAAQLGRDMETAIRSAAERLRQPLDYVMSQVNAMLDGNAGATAALMVLDPALHERVRRARNFVDDLSLAAAGTLPTGNLRNTIVNNLGQWLRRSYACFDKASGWNYDGLVSMAKAKQSINGVPAADILDNAKKYLQAQTPGATAAEIEADMRDLMNRDEWEAALTSPGGVSKRTGSLMRRRDIAPEIRALMGEETNPVKRLISSASFQAQFVARHHGQKAMAAAGLTGGLFQRGRGGVFTVQIPNEHTWSGMVGLWTTPQLWEALKKAQGIHHDPTNLGGKLVEGLKALGNEAKLNRVALNPDSWMVNLLGNFASGVQSGDVFAFRFLARLQEAAGVVGSSKAKSGAMVNAAAEALQDARREMAARLTGMGVLGSSITLADLEASLPRHLLQWMALDQRVNRAAGAVKGAIVGQGLGRGFGPAGRVAGGVAGAAAGAVIGAERIQDWQQKVAGWVMTGPDALMRTTGFLTNYETGLAAGMKPDKAMEWAATRTLNTYPNYNALPGLLREGSRLGLLGSFIAFQYEVYRNFGWNVAYAWQEIGSGNPAMMQRGLQRLTGVGAIAGMMSGGLAWLLGATGAAAADDERSRKFRKWYGAPWEKDAVLAFKRFDQEGVNYFNTSYLLPQQTMNELLQAAREGKNPADSAGRVIDRLLFEQFLQKSVHLGPIMAAVMNQNRAGTPLTYKTGVEGALERADEPLQTIMEPGLVAKIEKLTYALRDAEKNGRKFSVEEEAKRLMGIRQETRTWDHLTLNVYRTFAKRNSDIRSQANREIRENLPGATDKAIATANEELAKLRDDVRQFELDVGTLGVPGQIVRWAKREASVGTIADVALGPDRKRVVSLGGR
jgi:hypothetical protein